MPALCTVYLDSFQLNSSGLLKQNSLHKLLAFISIGTDMYRKNKQFLDQDIRAQVIQPYRKTQAKKQMYWNYWIKPGTDSILSLLKQNYQQHLLLLSTLR